MGDWNEAFGKEGIGDWNKASNEASRVAFTLRICPMRLGDEEDRLREEEGDGCFFFMRNDIMQIFLILIQYKR